jgi:hypothetical protein
MNVQRGDLHVPAYKLPPYEAAALSHSIQKLTIEEMSDEEISKFGPCEVSPSLSLQPNRRTKDGDVEMGTVFALTDAALSRHNTVRRKSNVNHLVYNWRSPIGKDSCYVCCYRWADGGNRNWRITVLVPVIQMIWRQQWTNGNDILPRSTCRICGLLC